MAASMARFCYFFRQTSTMSHKPRLKLSGLTNTSLVSALSYQVKQERLEEISKSPSGWVNPQDPPPSLPFQIKRSKTNNLPVYIDKKHGGSLVLTVVRNIKGDLDELEKFLKQNLGDNIHFQINEITSQIKIKGYHKDTVEVVSNSKQNLQMAEFEHIIFKGTWASGSEAIEGIFVEKSSQNSSFPKRTLVQELATNNY